MYPPPSFVAVHLGTTSTSLSHTNHVTLTPSATALRAGTSLRVRAGAVLPASCVQNKSEPRVRAARCQLKNGPYVVGKATRPAPGRRRSAARPPFPLREASEVCRFPRKPPSSAPHLGNLSRCGERPLNEARTPFWPRNVREEGPRRADG